MAFYSGSNGDLLIDGKKAAKVRSWSFTVNAETLDTTTLEDTDRTAIYGLRTASGACNLFYYASNPVTKEGNSASELLNKVIKARLLGSEPGKAEAPEKVTMRLRVDDGTTAGKYIEGDVLLTSVSMSMAVGEVLSASVSFDFNGAPVGVTF